MPHAGDLLADRYQLIELLGRGGMGEVWRAQDTDLGRFVAIKLVPAHLAGDATAEERLLTEARAAAALTHPNIVSVHDVIDVGGRGGIVMQLVAGPSLQEVVDHEAPIAWERACELITGIADGLAAAHARGLVHRDVKPGNVLLAADGTPKVTDFGLVRVLGATTTLTTTIRGSLAYVAPEQASGDQVDQKADVYALACIAVALLTGSPPFAADQPATLLHQHLHAAPPALSDLPPAMRAALHEGLAKDPAQRPDVRQLAARLTAAATGGGTTVVMPPTDAATTPITTGATRPIEAPAPARLDAGGAPPRRSRWPAALAVGAVILAGLLMLWLLRSDQPTSPELEAVPVTSPSPNATPTATAATEEQTAPSSLQEAVTAMRQGLVAARQAGELSGDGLDDLEERLEKVVEKAEDDKPQDAHKEQRELVKKIAELEREDKISPEVAQRLTRLAEQLAAFL